MWIPVSRVCLVVVLTTSCLIKGGDAISCHICNSNANKLCTDTLSANFSKDCPSNAIGCRKAIIEEYFYGRLIVRSCYNNTYTNHANLHGQYTRDTCTEYHLLTECICDTDNCNSAMLPRQHTNTTLTLLTSIFLVVLKLM